MSEGRRGQILHGVLGPSEDAGPEQFTCSQGFVELAWQESRHISWKCRNKTREGCVGARVILGHDGLTQDTEGEAELVNHGGHQGAAHDVAGDKAGSATPGAVRRPKPPQVRPLVACHQE